MIRFAKMLVPIGSDCMRGPPEHCCASLRAKMPKLEKKRFVSRHLGDSAAGKGRGRVQPFWGGIKTKRNGFITGVAGQSLEEARPHRSVAREDPSLLFAVPSWQKNVCGRASGNLSLVSVFFS